MKTFNDKEIIMLKEYLQGFLGKPTPFAKQKATFSSNRFCLWCEEWELIEMLKYLINGKDNYYRDPPPNRLRDSALLWSKEGIEAKVIKDLGNLETVEQMIEYFKNKREHFNEST